MDRQARAGLAVPEIRPSLRGLSHAAAFVVSVPLGLVLIFSANTGLGLAAAIVFAASVATMFGASALYHCLNWPERQRRWLRRVDHFGVYGLIAGTYTPIGLLLLDGHWRTVVLAIVWGGALAAILLKFIWLDAPKWLAAGIGLALGWVGVVVFPQLLDEIGLGRDAPRPRRRRSLHRRRARLRVPAPEPLSGGLRLPRDLPRPRDRGRRVSLLGGRFLVLPD